MRPITRLLVANRGEIARRVFRTAREMGIGSVAVYARPDAGLPFVREADTAIALDGDTAAESYLDIAKLIAAARRSGADAVHPGYGFLSENAAFARAVIEAGMTWVGPHPEAIAAMGDKLEARHLAVKAGVPVLPAIELPGGELPTAGVESLGLPILVKAAGGGGGRGMRVVTSASGLPGAIASARREARNAFGNDTVFLERYVEHARHIEVQVLGDKHGNLVHCFERECSIQRRHQKIIEEAPSPGVTPELRARLGDAALRIARAIGYDSAGTVEFIVDADTDHDFYFLEVNTRLQVEHPVTEEVTGLDLVREQLRVAMGQPLEFSQGELRLSGHAIEARLYAEDPAKNFLPAAGTVLAFVPPPEPAARFESGVESGSQVSVYFDPMLAKVIVHAPTRDEAAGRLALVLERLRIPGLTTNRDFLVNSLRHEAFLSGNTTTRFIDQHRPSPSREPGPTDLRFAAVAAAIQGQAERRAGAGVSRTIGSGWRNNPSAMQSVAFRCGETGLTVEYRSRPGGTFEVGFGDECVEARLHGSADGRLDLEVDGERRQIAVLRDGETWHTHDGRFEIALTELPRFPERGELEVAGGYTAPMPGKVIAVHVKAGDRVEKNQVLLVLEAMKMEHHVTAAAAGTVHEVHVAPGEQVDGGAVMVTMEEAQS
jgi:propionyl-CoA carboxylase alpha chain